MDLRELEWHRSCQNVERAFVHLLRVPNRTLSLKHLSAHVPTKARMPIPYLPALFNLRPVISVALQTFRIYDTCSR
jgi:hypothetical protein